MPAECSLVSQGLEREEEGEIEGDVGWSARLSDHAGDPATRRDSKFIDWGILRAV